MPKAFFKSLSVFLLAAFFIASDAAADRRKYVWTYQFITMPAQATELEFYQTSTSRDDNNRWEYRIEIEHGLTDRWDVSLYEIFVQDQGPGFRWDAFQVRTRYKLAPAGKFLLDPLLYLEYNRKINLKRQNKLEAKLILARDFDAVNLAINPVYEFFFAPGEPVHEIGLDAALSVEFGYRFSLGLETVTRWAYTEDFEEPVSYLGPTVSLASGGTYFTVGLARGITDESDDSRVRLILGVPL